MVNGANISTKNRLTMIRGIESGIFNSLEFPNNKSEINYIKNAIYIIY